MPCPACLQRMLMKIQKFYIDLVYKPGMELLIAEALSRPYYKENKYDAVLEEEI